MNLFSVSRARGGLDDLLTIIDVVKQVGWDESTAGERQPRVSAWEIEPLTTPFMICPPPQSLPVRTKRSRPSRGQGHSGINGTS